MRRLAVGGGVPRSPLLVAVAALLVALVLVAPMSPGAPPAAEATARESTARCADLVVLGVRASGQRFTSSSRGMGPEVHAAVRNAVGRLRGDHAVRLAGLDYPATPTSAGTAAYLASVRDGTARLGKRLVRLLASCRRTRVALVGFSQGAHVVHGTLATVPLSAARARRVVAVGLIADPTYNRRSTHAHQVRYGVTAPRVDGLLGPGRSLPEPLARRTIDFCHPDDLVCSFGGPDGQIWMARLAGRQHTAFYEQPATIGTHGAWLARVMQAHGLA